MNNLKTNMRNGMQRSAAAETPLTGLVDGALNRFFDDRFWGFNGIGQQRNVPVNVRDRDDSYEIEVVAPGLRKEDFRISLNDKQLTVAFEHSEEARKENEKGYLQQEYRLQSFSRSFHVDDNLVDTEAIKARYENGVLWLSIPKKESAQRNSRQISIE
ncbi:MAG: Hsp20 family protein [Chitinophagaceae bacterium]|nr:MAG: Hsp20 family protein [Chitinophagaceae bacterium]